MAARRQKPTAAVPAAPAVKDAPHDDGDRPVKPVDEPTLTHAREPLDDPAPGVVPDGEKPSDVETVKVDAPSDLELLEERENGEVPTRTAVDEPERNHGIEQDHKEDAEKPGEGVPSPGAAPLEGPTAPPSNDEPKPPSIPEVSPHEAGVLLAVNSQGTRLLDAGAGTDMGTEKTPDPDGLFVRVTPSGTTWECTRRIEQVSYTRPFLQETRQLVLGEGARVEEAYVEQLLALIREQVAADEAAAQAAAAE